MKSRLWVVIPFYFLLALVCTPLLAADTTPPQLVSLSLSAATVDTSLSDQTITVTVRVTDDLSGITGPPGGSVNLTFVSPSHLQRATVSFYAFNRQSGSATDGIYTSSLILRRYSEPGVWMVEAAGVSDTARNGRTFELADFQAAGLPTQIIIQGTGDVTPPQLAGLSLPTATVDTMSADQILPVTIRATDDLSGVASEFIVFRSPSTKQYASIQFQPKNRESGSALDGFYSNNLVLPRYSEPGIWTAYQATLSDTAGNQRAMTFSDFEAAGLPTQITVQGSGDTTPPQIMSLSLSATTVDTSNGSQTLQATLRITDDLSGFTRSALLSSSFDYGRASFVYLSPSRAQQTSVHVFASNLESGSAKDGIYTSNLVLPRHSEVGVWTVEFCEVLDGVGNRRTLGLSDFLAAGWPARILVTEQPMLRLLRSGEAALLCWPASQEGYVLQSKASLDSGVSWTNVPGAPVLLGEDRILSLPLREGAAFFRLQKPAP